MFVLKADAAGSAIVDPVEVLNRCHDRIRRIVRIDLHSHGNPSPHLRVLIKEQLESNVFGDGGSMGGFVRRMVIRVGG